jgi:hypothetical protein
MTVDGTKPTHLATEAESWIGEHFVVRGGVMKLVNVLNMSAPFKNTYGNENGWSAYVVYEGKFLPREPYTPENE